MENKYADKQIINMNVYKLEKEGNYLCVQKLMISFLHHYSGLMAPFSMSIFPFGSFLTL